jgi:hypothetical protein
MGRLEGTSTVDPLACLARRQERVRARQDVRWRPKGASCLPVDKMLRTGSPLLAAVLRSARIAPGFVRRILTPILTPFARTYTLRCPSAVHTKDRNRTDCLWTGFQPPRRPGLHCTTSHRTDFLYSTYLPRSVASRLFRWTLSAFLDTPLVSGQERASGKYCVPEPPG